MFLRRPLEGLESVFGLAFGPRLNPFYHLGALGWFFYWIVAVSGVYLYIFFDTGVTEAYASVEQLTHVQWYAGGIMRSLHRYASDALVVVVLLHLLREFILDRFRDARRFAWVIGVASLWLIYASGISGYWVVWDKLAQYVAIATSEWLDTLPVFGEPIARNFLHPTVLSGRFFTLMVFIHIAVPLILLLVMWIHVARHTRAETNPPRALAIGTLVALLVLSVSYPAVSQGPANLHEVPAVVGLDWFYLLLYPLLDRYPGLMLWALVGGATLLLVLLPWLPPYRRRQPASVHLDNCNGCGRCEEDCPYNAIVMGPRTDGTPFAREAVVSPQRCVSCGICAGACPTAMPYRRRTALVAGIDLPEHPIASLRAATLAASAGLEGAARVIVYGCERGVDLGQIESEGVAVIRLPCIGNLPPAFVDFVISGGRADGVLLTGCREGDCGFRLGIEWTKQRLDGERDPFLRARVPRERIETVWAGAGGGRRLRQRVAAFRAALRTLGPAPGGAGRRALTQATAAEHP